MMRFAVIGSGKMAVEVCKQLLQLEDANVCCAIADPRHETAQTSFAEFARSRGIAAIEATRLGADVDDLLQRHDLDYLISANNHFILKAMHLSSARRGAINFHNGPLPRYAGINPCSWALLNGENTYGVTWHFIDEGIDTGDVLRQVRFPIEPDETAIELIARCIEAGIELFQLVAQDLLSDAPPHRTAQDLSQRSYFGIKDRPWNGGFPFWAPRSELLRLHQALAFWPMPNLFYRPSVVLPEIGRVDAGRYEYRSHTMAGRIGAIYRNSEGLIVTVDGGSALLTELSDEHGVPLELSRFPERMMLMRNEG